MVKPKLQPANILLEKHLAELGIPYSKECRFSSERKWQFDYLLCDSTGHSLRLAVEIEGSVYAQGRHTRGKGFEEDCIKYNTATMMGYRVLRFSTGQVLRGQAKAFLASFLLTEALK